MCVYFSLIFFHNCTSLTVYLERSELRKRKKKSPKICEKDKFIHSFIVYYVPLIHQANARLDG